MNLPWTKPKTLRRLKGFNGVSISNKIQIKTFGITHLQHELDPAQLFKVAEEFAHILIAQISLH